LHTESKTRVAIDTNMLLSIGELGVDVFLQLEKMLGKSAEIAMPEQVVEELKKLECEKVQKENVIAMEETKRHKVKVVQMEARNADTALEKMAKQGYMIATNDKALRKRIKGFGGTVIYLRQGRFLKKD